jgi:hypothetical protein
MNDQRVRTLTAKCVRRVNSRFAFRRTLRNVRAGATREIAGARNKRLCARCAATHMMCAPVVRDLSAAAAHAEHRVAIMASPSAPVRMVRFRRPAQREERNMSTLSLRGRSRTLAAILGGFAAAIGFANPSQAEMIQIEADMENRFKGIGSLTGSIEFVANASSTEGLLTVTLTNTMPADSNTFITGLVFNLDSADVSAATSLLTTPPNFKDSLKQHVPPFGHQYQFGAALKGHFMGGGDPRHGIAPGETRTFAFRVVANNAGNLSPMSFLNGPVDQNFLVRFRSVGQGGSDIVPVRIAAIPGPSALMLIALAVSIPRRARRQ